MTITLDALSGTQIFGGGSGPIIVSHTISAGLARIVIAFVGTGGAAAPSVVKYNNVSMHLAVHSANYSHLYYLLDAELPGSPGAKTLSVTLPGGAPGGIWCLSLFGVKQTTPEATAEKSTGSVSGWTTDITTLTDDAWIIDGVYGYDRTFTPDAGQTERYDFLDDASAGMCGSTKPAAVAGAKTMGWAVDSGSGFFNHALAAFAPYVPSPEGVNPVAATPNVWL